MSNKLDAFLNKNKKKGKKGKDQPQADAGQTATEEAKDQTAKDAEVIKKQEPAATKNQNAGESSEDDEDDKGLNYGIVKEKVTDNSKD